MNQQQREAALRLAEAKLAACMASRDALRDWAQKCRDQVLYLLAQRDDELGRTADGLGQASVGLLRELAAAPQGEPVAWPAGFDAWWESDGQFLRAGGGDYEKTFAYHAWLAAHPPQRQPLKTTTAPAPEADRSPTAP